jgi:hypothetical protein
MKVFTRRIETFAALPEKCKSYTTYRAKTFLPEKSGRGDILRAMADDDDILGLFETQQAPNEPEPPKESHPIRISKGVGTFLLSAGFTIVIGLIVGALQIAGVTSMSLAHLLIALAWVIAVFAIWLWLLSRPRKHTMKAVLVTALILGVVFFGVDRFMVWKKVAQDAATVQQPQSTPSVASSDELLNWQRGDPKNPPRIGFIKAVKPNGTLHIMFAMDNPNSFPAFDIGGRLWDMDKLPNLKTASAEEIYRSDIAHIDIPSLAPNTTRSIVSIDVPPSLNRKRFGAQFTTRAGAFSENIAAQKVNNTWFFAVQVRRFDATGEVMFRRIDAGFPLNVTGDVDW